LLHGGSELLAGDLAVGDIQGLSNSIKHPLRPGHVGIGGVGARPNFLAVSEAVKHLGGIKTAAPALSKAATASLTKSAARLPAAAGILTPT